MFDQRELDKGREWRLNQRSIVEAAAAAQRSQPLGDDARLFTAVWQTIRPWGLSINHARMICDAVKTVRP